MAAAVLGVLAGLCFAVAASLQQRAGRNSMRASGRARGGPLPIVGSMPRLVRDRLWLTGWTVNLAGFLSQAAALRRGSISLVQPLLVTQLLFAIPLSAMRARRGPRAGEWIAGGCICAGVAIFLGARSASIRSGDAPQSHTLAALATGLLVVAVLLWAGTGRRPAVHAAFASIAAGLSFALSAMLMKLTVDSLATGGVAATATQWFGYSLAVTTALGLVAGQDALTSGALPSAIAGMVITNPLASTAIGVLAFADPAPTSPAALAAMSLAGALMTVGVIGLARSPTVRDEIATAPPTTARGRDPRPGWAWG